MTGDRQSDVLAQAVGKVPMKVWESQGNMVFSGWRVKDVKELEPDMHALAQLDTTR